MKLPEKIYELRKANNLSQEQLAKYINFLCSLHDKEEQEKDDEK